MFGVMKRVRLGRPRRQLALRRVLTEFGRANPRASFIQIGSNDGVRLDPLHEQILAWQWAGVLVEPIPYVFERLRRNYAGVDRVLLENVAIADHDGYETLYYLPESRDTELPAWYDSLGSFRKDVILRHRAEIPDIDERLAALQVPCLTFESLCQRAGLDQVDLIHTDVEGYDYELLQLIDLSRFRPRLLVYEHYHLEPDTYRASVSYVTSHGYEVIAAGMDTICLDVARLSRRDRRLRRLWDDLRAEGSQPAFRAGVS